MVTAAPLEPRIETNPLRAGSALSAQAFVDLRRKLVLDGCKWDPQVGDVATIAPFPLILSAGRWRELAGFAEQLAAELMAAEAELQIRPDLHRQLGLPWRVRRLLRHNVPPPPVARVLRFDFHWTSDGWRISEVNSDVPGGFTEASTLPRMIAPFYPETEPAGDPAAMWADAIVSSASNCPHVALLAAVGFMEDQQIMAFLAKLIRDGGAWAHQIGINQLHWQDRRAFVETASYRGPVGAIVRFYQAEWLATLPRRFGARNFFFGGTTPISNSITSILTESKRFPLVWNKLSNSMPTWRSLLPETRDPRDAPWRTDDRWLLKSALCNTGDTVSIRTELTQKNWRAVCRDVWLWPDRWLAQRRFETLPLQTPAGSVFPCIGVYTIDGRAAGIYGRFSPRPLIDFSAVDVAVLIENDQ